MRREKCIEERSGEYGLKDGVGFQLVGGCML